MNYIKSNIRESLMVEFGLLLIMAALSWIASKAHLTNDLEIKNMCIIAMSLVAILVIAIKVRTWYNIKSFLSSTHFSEKASSTSFEKREMSNSLEH